MDSGTGVDANFGKSKVADCIGAIWKIGEYVVNNIYACPDSIVLNVPHAKIVSAIERQKQHNESILIRRMETPLNKAVIERICQVSKGIEEHKPCEGNVFVMYGNELNCYIFILNDLAETYLLYYIFENENLGSGGAVRIYSHSDFNAFLEGSKEKLYLVNENYFPEWLVDWGASFHCREKKIWALPFSA